MTTQTETTQKNHRRAVRFFWCFLICASVVSLIGNVVHAVLPYVSQVVIQIGAAAVPPIALLAAVHGIGLAVRAGASGPIYRCAVTAVAAIGVGAFWVSFLALRDLMLAIGYSSATAWVFPAIIDTTVAVSTMMLVALGDKPARRNRTVAESASAQLKASAPTALAHVSTAPKPHSVRADRVAVGVASAPRNTASLASSAPDHHALALALVDAGATTKTAAVVESILTAHAEGTALNRIAADVGVHHKTVSKIIDAAETHRHHLVAV